MRIRVFASLLLLAGTSAPQAFAAALVSVGEGFAGGVSGGNQSATGRAEYSIETASTSASAYADVATGRMGVRIDAAWGGQATASIGENIYFNIPGAASTTRTPITIYLSLDGDRGNINTVQYQFRATRDYPYALSKGGIPINPATLLTGDIGNPEKMLAQNCSLLGDPFNFDAVCTFDIYGSTDWIGLSQSIHAGGPSNGNRVWADFSHTASIKIIVPEGVTWTSGSGSFLTATVPEPATWALMVAGFGAVGYSIRARRQRPPESREARQPVGPSLQP